MGLQADILHFSQTKALAKIKHGDTCRNTFTFSFCAKHIARDDMN